MSQTVPCDACDGVGMYCASADTEPLTCMSCQGQGHIEVNALTRPEVICYLLATRCALGQQTYMGQHVIAGLTAVVDRMPYEDRKVLETEIADALFAHRVDPSLRGQWEGLVERIRRVP